MLVNDAELQVRSRYLDDNVPVAFDQRHPSVGIPVRSPDRLELDIDFEIGTVATDERSTQPGGLTTFRREDFEQISSGHSWLDGILGNWLSAWGQVPRTGLGS